MKMSEAYDRTKKLESMISDLQRGMNILMTTPMPNERAVIPGLDISILALKEKKDELTEAVTALGNMEVVEPPTPPAVATPEDYAAGQIGKKMYDQQQEERPEWAGGVPKTLSGVSPDPRYGYTGKRLVGGVCLFSNDNRTWVGPLKCVDYNEDSPTPYMTEYEVFAFAKWYDGIEKASV